MAQLARTTAGTWPAFAHGLADAVRYADGREALYGYPALALLSTYLSLALRRVHPEPWGWAAGRTFAMAWVPPRIFDVYRDLLFAITPWST